MYLVVSVDRSLFTRLGLTSMLLAVAVAGCSKAQPGPEDATDFGLINQLVWEISETEGREPERFEAVFAEGALPQGAERKRFATYHFKLLENVEVTGDTATLTVKVWDFDADQTSDAEAIGDVTWKAVKKDGDWWISEAPLP